MLIAPQVVQSLSLKEAVQQELWETNKLLPLRWTDVALRQSTDFVSDWLSSILRREWHPDAEEIILTRKLDKGARPIAVMGLRERLVYRAAGAVIAEHVGWADRSWERFDAFRRAPLEQEGCTHILKTDIAAYYQYIDHERMIDEVVARIGDELAVELMVDLLQETSSRRFGLPQLNPISDVLGDLYIEPMRRLLRRAGFNVWNYSDDFRVACSNYAECLAALEAADQAARELGLVLNESKTVTIGFERYVESLDYYDERDRELLQALAPQEGDVFGAYSAFDDWDEVSLGPWTREDAQFDEGVGPEETHLTRVSDRQLEAARSAMDSWDRHRRNDALAGDQVVSPRVVGQALRVLAQRLDRSALSFVPALLVYTPGLTPTICRYIRACAEIDVKGARGSLDRVCDSPIVGAWQALWIAHTAGFLPRGVREGRVHVQWLKRNLMEGPPALAAEAALSLGRLRLGERDALVAAAARISGPHRSTVMMGLAAGGETELASSIADSELDRRRADWAAERL